MKKLISVLLSICIIVSATCVVSAKEDEEYLSDLRIVYADSYEEAKKIIQNSEFKKYQVLDYNLNKSAAKVDIGITIGDSGGAYLAYLTTTDVDDAITDVAIMQMNGGYKDGNYQEMVEKSRRQYLEVGNTYLTAVNYMIEAYYAGDFLAQCAYRQLEFYYDDDSKMTLGAFFETQPGADALATMFLEGNSYAIKNVRALIGMGVSYNDDGMTYLQKVSNIASEMDSNPNMYLGEDYEDTAMMISTSMVTFRDMLEEVSAYEDELNYADDDYTDLEMQYVEHTALAEMFKKVPYLGGKTLYEFCLNYNRDELNLSSLYPLASALNEGQKAITTAGNFYDAVRYSMTDFPEEYMNEEIEKLEAVYLDDPFSIYTGVDRSVYTGTFALTTEAYRTDISSDSGFFSSFYGLDGAYKRGVEIVSASIGAGLFAYAIHRTKDALNAKDAAQKAFDAALKTKTQLTNKLSSFRYDTLLSVEALDGGIWEGTPDDFINELLEAFPTDKFDNLEYFQHTDPFVEKVNYLKSLITKESIEGKAKDAFDYIVKETDNIVDDCYPNNGGVGYGEAFPSQTAVTSIGSTLFTVALYAVGAAMMIYSAYSYGSAVHSYYNPEYDDIPVSMVDLVVTDNGDRYIKYDAVTMAEMNDKKEYDPADLNVFEGQRWNAIYYTKSYEAGKPLLAKFKVSNNNNTADKNYLPVHRFGEDKCYDLNKHNFTYDVSIYLSIAQSKNQKTAISGVPTVVGSMLANGIYFLAGGIGLAFGSLITLGAKSIKKKKENTN